MTAPRDIAARLLEPHTLDIRNIVEVRAILDLVAVERTEAAAEIASLRLKVEELERERDEYKRQAELAERQLLAVDRVLAWEYSGSGRVETIEKWQARLAALEDQNRALEAATIEKCAKVADEIRQPGVVGSSEWIKLGNFAGKIAEAIRALASIPGEAG